IPGELLAEDELGLHGLHDAHEDPAEVDEAAGEYRRRHQIRERARQLAMTQSSREAIRRSRHAAQQQRHWAPGQWVYVFRRARGNQDLHLRDRWVGPGVVVVSNNDTVYVGMRTRLWRCSPGQLRAALPSEVLGRELATSPGLSELLRQVISGTHAGAVDVQREGLPGPENMLGPVQRTEDGVAVVFYLLVILEKTDWPASLRKRSNDLLVEEFNRLAQRRDQDRRDDPDLWREQWFQFNQEESVLCLEHSGEWEEIEKSDEVEWSAVLGTGAVKVIIGKTASKAREDWPDRIISSRMVRRKKPQPELNAWKGKSRWCIHGHHDPDTGTLCTYSPTPSTEGLMTFLQTGLNFGMKFAFSDVKNAFCQSDKLNRPRGPLYAEPCEGLHLPAGALIEILVPTSGLDDAPREWRLTVTRFLTSLSFERNLVEPCWYTLFSDKKECIAQVLIEVDDFIVCAAPDRYEWLKKQLTSRFHFGKWEEDEAEYAGRHVRVTPE
ncbi:unnamed protein product, partial [Durusdinium trenchii]